jgi:hypothetical protein
MPLGSIKYCAPGVRPVSRFKLDYRSRRRLPSRGIVRTDSRDTLCVEALNLDNFEVC